MIRICRNPREVMKYKRLSFLQSGIDSIPVLLIDNELFIRARELFAGGNVLIEVKDGNGETAFFLKRYHDMIGTGNGNTDVDLNFQGCNLLQDKNLDNTLLEKVRCFVIEELEEYTFELTRYIVKKYPDAQIFYLDHNATYFFTGKGERVSVLSSIDDINLDNKYMYIFSDIKRHEHIIPENVSLIYNSENVMSSLCWARKVDHLGPKNPDKVILLIDMEFGKGCGLAFIVRTVCTFVCMAYERGWVPVANLTGNNMYIDSPRDNMWEQYFLPVSDITVSDALESQNVISVKNNQLSSTVIYINPFFREIWEKTEKHPRLVFNNEVKQYFKAYMPQEVQEENNMILGALIRGTDANDGEVSEEEIELVVSECKEIMHNSGFDRLFLATEDAAYFEAFQREFQEKLIAIEQKRVVAYEQDKKSIGELLDIKIGEKKNFGQKYLMITHCLAQRHALAYNKASGGYYLTNIWREKPFASSYRLIERETELDRVIKYLEMVEKNDKTAIYGTGIMGKRILDILGQKNISKIVFCDKKAEKSEYSFGQSQVISPYQLLKEYERNCIQGIIIATVKYTEEIYDSLIKKGVDSKHIMCVKGKNGVL